MKKAAVLLFVVAAVAAGVGFVVTRHASISGGTTTSTASMPSASAVAPALGYAAASPATDALTQKAAAAPATAPVEGLPATAGGSVSAAEPFATSPATIGEKVVKTADLTIQVKTFQSAWTQASDIATRFGGFILSSSASGNPERSGTLVMRVPSQNFDAAMRELGALGTAQHESTNGQVVTNQFIDLGARLKSWQAQENVLFRLMDKANSISETMTVQRQLQQVQFQIEQIKGQLRVLRDQTSLATITLTLHEPGVAVSKPPASKPSLETAWDRAVAGFLGVVALVIVGLGYLVPLSLLAGLVYVIARRVRGTPVRQPVS
jgi:hypothetical protein